MLTVHRAHYGPPEALAVREAPVPEPRPGELLVRVRATTVNRTDCGGLRGRPFVYRFFAGFPRPRFAATGTDFAGEVVAVGAGTRRFGTGERIFGFDDHGIGSHAQYFCVGEGKAMARIPDGVGYAEAAASAEGAHYARNFLRKVRTPAASEVLVVGGTGAIGSAAIQLLRHQGVRVTAVCFGPHIERVRQLGAERVVDQAREDFAGVLAAAGATFDHVFDAVGKSTFARCRPLLRPGGRYLSSELGSGAQNILLALAAPLLAPFCGGRRVVFPIPVDCQASITAMQGLLAAGAFRPLIDRRFALGDIRGAFRYVESGQKLGNVVLEP
ncbi:MAG: NAD(P)-dependent alcohol dehydrogenase [Planctomycetes bacterium]|nr:NAD(P)-dependent alcohol dehydrogenase [Planctomycetota bacterium]